MRPWGVEVSTVLRTRVRVSRLRRFVHPGASVIVSTMGVTPVLAVGGSTIDSSRE